MKSESMVSVLKIQHQKCLVCSEKFAVYGVFVVAADRALAFPRRGLGSILD